MRTRLHHALLAAVLAGALFAPGAQAQLPSLSKLGVPEEPKPPDRLQRNTPRGTMIGFVQAAQSGRWQIASEYLQLTPSERKSRGTHLAQQLRTVLDEGYTGNLDRLSNDPRGTVQEGYSQGQEFAGSMVVGGKLADVILAQVTEKDSPPIWLISRQTLDRLPELYAEIGMPQWESRLPEWLVQIELYSIPLWKWVAVLVAFPFCLAIAWVLIRMLALPYLLIRRARKQLSAPELGWRRPVTLFAAMGLHALVTIRIGLPLMARQQYVRVLSVLLAASAAWLVLYWIDLAADGIRYRLLARANSAGRSLLVLTRRIVKVVAVCIFVLSVLKGFGVNISVALTGLGIGGVALALAAQKTLENLFGGASVLGDRSIQVGDVCRLGTQLGEVEDIGLRSTAIRTLDRSLLHVPNGALAMMNVENLSRRDKFLFRHTIGLRYETSPDQMRFVLAEIRRLLYEHPKVETESARVRFLRFSSYSLDLEAFAYVLSADYSEFLAIQEDLLLRIMDLVPEAGTGFAFPSQTAYASRDAGLDEDKTKAAEEQVRRWRGEKQLPFPDHPPADVKRMHGKIAYPPEGSALESDTVAGGPGA